MRRAAVSILALPLLASAAPTQKRWQGAEACSYIATQTLNDPRDVVACLKSFPFREDLRQNVLAVAESVASFYTYETSAVNSPAPYQESTVDLEGEFNRIRYQHYDTDYDFNVDLYFTVNRLNDGHTLWLPYCYVDAFQNLLPIPIVSLAKKADSKKESIYVIPDADAFFSQYLKGQFNQYYQDKGINITRLAGAEVTSIEGQDPYAYVSQIASNYTGNYLDHGIRENSVYSSYRYTGGKWGQRLGDFAGPIVPSYPKYEITVTLVPTDTKKPETVTIPYVSTFLGKDFTDQGSYWENNCAALNTTNGVDYKLQIVAANSTNSTNTSSQSTEFAAMHRGKRAVAALPDLNARREAINLPQPYVPTAYNASGSDDITYYTMLPETSVGVMMLGSFSPADYYQWQTNLLEGINGLKDQGADHLIIDLTNNGGGYVCEGYLLHRLLAGPSVDPNPSFESVVRANELAKQMMASNIELAKTYDYYQILPNYFPPAWNHIAPNGSAYGPAEDFMEPSSDFSINGIQDSFSQRTADSCTPWNVDVPAEQPFDLSRVIIVGNANCASTCSAFTTLMHELHGVKIVNFGAAKGAYSGMAGAEVLEWDALDSEFKTANLKDSPLAGPDLVVNANFRNNWRASYSYRRPDTFNPYNDDVADYIFSYTADTWNNPQALWSFVASEVLGVKIKSNNGNGQGKGQQHKA
ncbi:hypothetical protein QFC24_001293 [Naganishia onofrii]|uniref:Uncharacterized protein n=1 Tax=Naganishia onofrii TaxID=1851511 RepID=A0ACC2XSP2_9TREE|nr:hypothetical protein QFC24_001293 [Naganishia onofrii]